MTDLFTADTRVDGNPMLIVHGDDDDEKDLQDVTQDRFLMKRPQPPRGNTAAASSSAPNNASPPPRVDGNVSDDPFLAHSLPDMPVVPPPAMVGDDPFMKRSTAIPAKVSLDPFLTRTLRNRVDDGDPFLRNVGCKRNLRVAEDVRADPFLTKAPSLGEQRQGTSRYRCMRRFEISCMRSRWKCSRNCGAVEEAIDRRCTTFGDQLEGVGADIILAPWTIYVATVLTWIIGGHYFPLTSVFITHACALYYLGQVVFWSRTAWTPHPEEEWIVLRRQSKYAICCLLSVVSGLIIGHLIWHDSLRSVWWMSTGIQYTNTTAVTPAVARGDAAWIHFEDAPRGTSVDITRAAGFREGAHMYCAAPLLSAEALGGGDAPLASVSYWAVGMDCCQSKGSFTCDASRDRQGAYGVVMLDRGFPCAGCNTNRFEAAMAKAEAVHGLVSSEGALFVRWVKDPGDILTESSRWAFMLTAFSFFVALWIFVAIAWALDRSETFAIEHFAKKRFKGRELAD